jgi:hypothetical protein
MSLKSKLIIDIPLTTGGTSTINNGIITLPLSNIGGLFEEYCTEYRVTGTQTLGSNFSIAMSTPDEDTEITFYWQAVCTPSGFVVSILGKVIPTEYVGKNFIIKLSYRDAAWVVDFFAPSLFVASSLSGDRLIDATIATAKLIDLSVTTAKINDLGVTTGKVADLAITTAKIADTAVTTGKITDLNVTTGKLADAAVTTVKITDLNVTTGKVADLAITTGKLADTAVTTAKITDLNVTTGKLADLAVTTAKINDLAVTAAKIADATITPAKLTSASNTYTRDITLSFASATEVGNVNFTMFEACSITEISVTVLQPAAGDDATLIFKDNGGTVLTGSQVDITTALVLGNKVATTPSANNVFAAGHNLLIEMSKTTKTSGKVNIALKIVKS